MANLPLFKLAQLLQDVGSDDAFFESFTVPELHFFAKRLFLPIQSLSTRDTVQSLKFLAKTSGNLLQIMLYKYNVPKTKTFGSILKHIYEHEPVLQKNIRTMISMYAPNSSLNTVIHALTGGVDIDNDDNMCSICYNEIEPGTDASAILPCMHARQYHRTCLQQWIDASGDPTCPMRCGAEVDVNAVNAVQMYPMLDERGQIIEFFRPMARAAKEAFIQFLVLFTMLSISAILIVGTSYGIVYAANEKFNQMTPQQQEILAILGRAVLAAMSDGDIHDN